MTDARPSLFADAAVRLLADELNQFMLTVEVYADRKRQGAIARLEPKAADREALLFDAARRMRERIAELIPA